MTAQVKRCNYLSVKFLRNNFLQLMIVFVLIVAFPFHIPFTVEFFLSVKISLDEKWKGESNANKSCWPGRYCSIHRTSGTRGAPRARENQNGPERVRLGGRVNEAALN